MLGALTPSAVASSPTLLGPVAEALVVNRWGDGGHHVIGHSEASGAKRRIYRHSATPSSWAAMSAARGRLLLAEDGDRLGEPLAKVA
jgi:hypothetical protein